MTEKPYAAESATDASPARPKKTTAPKLAYSIREVCDVTSLGRSTIYNHIKAGNLRINKVGGRALVTADELRRFIGGQ